MVGLLAALMVLTPATGVPTALLAAAEPAPTDVTVAWETPAHTRVVVTWKETGDLRNRVDVVHLDGTPSGYGSRIVEAGQPNQSELPGRGVDQQYRVTVRAIDADGTEISEPGQSPVFDTDRQPTPVMRSTVPREDGTIEIRWSPGAYTDATPGDPLDLPAVTPQRFIPIASVFTFNEYEVLSPPITATTFVVPERETPVRVGVRTVANEWGASGATTQVLGSRVTASVPRTAVTGQRLNVTGKAVRVHRACDPGPCGTTESPASGRPVRLEARTGATANWQTVASARAQQDGRFSFRITSPGTRQYRVVAPVVLQTADQEPMAYATTPVTTTRATSGSAGDDNGDNGSGEGLPITGAPVAVLLAGGGLLVALGAVLARTGRTRRQTRSGL